MYHSWCGYTLFVNGNTKQYQVVHDGTGKKLQILEDGMAVFQGEAVPMGDSWWLMEENGKFSDVIQVTVGTGYSDPETLYPSYTQLYGWAVAQKYDMRGNFVMLFCILLIAAVLALDILFPNLFFTIRYGLAVDGGEPSDLYRTGQIFGRVICGIAIIGCVIASFVVH